MYKKNSIKSLKLYSTSSMQNLGTALLNSLNIDSLRWYISGLIDAEGSFGVSIVKKDSNKTGYGVLVYFEIALNKKDKNLLEIIMEVLGLKSNLYYNQSDETYKLKVSSIYELTSIIIPHFNKFPLYTQKRVDFLLMCQVIKLIEEKRHITIEGLKEIIQIKTSLNLGISDGLKRAFPDIEPLTREIISTGIPNLDWLGGFIEGEGCFFVSVYNSPRSKLKLAVQLVFKITQHIRDIELLLNITKLLGCGRVETRKSGDACDFAVTSIKDIEKYIIPYLNTERYHLKGLKLNNYNDFKKISGMMVQKEHLTKTGLAKIVEMKKGMNIGRI